MKIGELAAAAECDVATVRYYEKAGLMPPPGRTVSNYRAYGPTHVERLQFIRRCRALDMGLDEVRLLLSFVDQPEQQCGMVNTALDEHIEHVESRLRELAGLRDELKRLRQQCRRASNAATCGILGELKSTTTRKSVKSKVRGAH